MRPRSFARTWLPLARAALCLNDETIFDVREARCPVCGQDAFVLITRWLQETTL